MKRLLFILLSLFCIQVNATNYYFAVSGNDANAGTISSPWQTLSKFNSVNGTKNANDSFLFNRGDVFYGKMLINRNNINIGAYGTGANPIITGFTTISAWTNLGSNIWESSSAVSSLSTCNMVTIGNVEYAMGRTPNTGWYTYSASTTSSLTSTSLNATTTNWTGAEVVSRRVHWEIMRYLITSASGTTINYTSTGNQVSYAGIANYGFFIQNDPRTLDQQNEWYYNPSTKKLQIYSTSTPTNVQLVTVDTLLTITSRSTISFSHISFIGSNQDGATISADHISFNDCLFDFSGKDAIWGAKNIAASGNFVFQNSYIRHTNNNAINLETNFSGASIINDTIQYTGLLEGMKSNGSSNYGDLEGIQVRGANSNIQYCEVDSSGYNAISFYGNGTTVQNNYVNYFNIKLDDGAGLYSWVGTGNTHFTSQKVLNNIVLNGIGNNAGTADTGVPVSHGIYLDDVTYGIEVGGNTSANNSYSGLFLHNSNSDNIHDNHIYNNGYAQTLIEEYDLNNKTRSLTFVNNQLIAKTSTEKVASVQSKVNDLDSFFVKSDTNYFARPISDATPIETIVNNYATTNNISLTTWQSTYNYDSHSHKSPKAITSTDSLLFQANPTSSIAINPMSYNYEDVKGTQYNGIDTLQPYTSLILIQNGSITGNIAPTANAGSDQIIQLPVSSVTLTGSGNDVDGTVASYSWSKTSGGSATITSPTSSSTTVTGLVQGVYQFKLTVTDNLGATGTDIVQVTVNAANQPPVANAGTDQSITLPTSSVTLNGSGNDPDGTVVSYAWTKIAGSGTITSSSSASTSVTGLTAGISQFQLVVTDNQGATGADTVKVIVSNTPNKAPVANAGSDSTIQLPITTVHLIGSGHDSDGVIVSYAWTKITGGPATITSPSSASTTVTGLSAGTYQFKLTVTDDSSATGSDVVIVTVLPANQPPTANAGTDQTIYVPASTVTISGSASDADGTVASHIWTKTSGSGTITSPSSYSTTVTGLTLGTSIFRITATDNQGATGFDEMIVTVNPPSSAAPTVNAGADQHITTTSTTVTATATHASGHTITYLWSQLTGASSTIASPNTANTDITGLAIGVYTYKILVTQDDSQTAADTIQITVTAPNVPPTANAGSDVNITLPVNYTTLSGSGMDTDGSVVAYSWSKVSGPSNYIITGATTTTPSLTSLVQGTYVFRLTVTDNNGATGSDTVSVTVTNPGTTNLRFYIITSNKVYK